MWSRPVSLFGSGSRVVTITSDEWIGNLWDYLGQPSDPIDVLFTVIAADAGGILIPLDFDAGSTFTFIAISNGRFVGEGGDGGQGGDDNGATGSRGRRGLDGGHAIESFFPIDIDIDNGYLFGGGGGGAGCSFEDLGGNGHAGGGGGGGQGFSGGAGGPPGFPSSPPEGNDGGDGSDTGAGLGGLGGGGVLAGGDGGTWGHGGVIGDGDDWTDHGDGQGGMGGPAGNAFYGHSVVATFNGASSKAALRTAGRIIGETEGWIKLPEDRWVQAEWVINPEQAGWGFQADTIGTLLQISSSDGNTSHTQWWADGTETIVSTDYDVREVVGTRTGAWNNDPAGLEGDWRNISTNRVWELDDNGDAFVAQVFEIKRADDASGGILCSGYMEAELKEDA
jgi:hypothetical protein